MYSSIRTLLIVLLDCCIDCQRPSAQRPAGVEEGVTGKSAVPQTLVANAVKCVYIVQNIVSIVYTSEPSPFVQCSDILLQNRSNSVSQIKESTKPVSIQNSPFASLYIPLHPTCSLLLVINSSLFAITSCLLRFLHFRFCTQNQECQARWPGGKCGAAMCHHVPPCWTMVSYGLRMSENV